MTFLKRIINGLRALVWRHEAEQELDTELGAYFDALVEQRMAAGESREQAERAARREIGSTAALKDRVRDVGWETRLESVWRDMRYGVKRLIAVPGHMFAVLLMFAIGTGATTAVFAVVNGVLLMPLPYADPGRLLRLSEERPGNVVPLSDRRFTSDTWRAWKAAASSTLIDVAVYNVNDYSVRLAPEVVRVSGAAMSANGFDVLGATPALGRFFQPAELERRTDVVVLSDRLWRERFGADAGVIGRTLSINGTAYTIVGVARPGFYFPDRRTMFWVSYAMPSPAAGASPAIVCGFGRSKPGATVAQVEAEGTAIARAVDRRTPRTAAIFGDRGAIVVRAMTLVDELSRPIRPALLALNIGVGVVLLLVCANIANLWLVRGATRRRELAVQLALGARHGRLVRQIVIETFMLAGAGSLMGWIAARELVRRAPAMMPSDFPRLDDIQMDGRVTAFAIAMSLLTALMSSLWPTLRSAMANPADALHDGHGRTYVQGLPRRGGLIAMEAGLAVVLLVVAALLGQSFVRLMHVDKGYDEASVLAARVYMPSGVNVAQRNRELLDRVLERLREIPGVTAAGAGNMMPFGDSTFLSAFDFPKSGEPGRMQLARAVEYSVTPGYAEALGLRVREGRPFVDGDQTSPVSPVLVNREFARLYLPPGPVAGLGFSDGIGATAGQIQIVGLVDNVLKDGLDRAPQPEIYTLASRSNGIRRELYLAIRTTGDPLWPAERLRVFVRQAAPDAMVANVAPLSTLLSISVQRPRFATMTAAVFALIGVTVAGAGLYAVLAFTVAYRRRELAIRTALGATRAALVWLIVRQVLRPAVAGLTGGLVASAVITRLLARALFGVSPFEPIVFISGAAMLLLVSMIAALVPVYRAAHIDPAVLLQEE
jgi:predicted permease